MDVVSSAFGGRRGDRRWVTGAPPGGTVALDLVEELAVRSVQLDGVVIEDDVHVAVDVGRDGGPFGCGNGVPVVVALTEDGVRGVVPPEFRRRPARVVRLGGFGFGDVEGEVVAVLTPADECLEDDPILAALGGSRAEGFLVGVHLVASEGLSRRTVEGRLDVLRAADSEDADVLACLRAEAVGVRRVVRADGIAVVAAVADGRRVVVRGLGRGSYTRGRDDAAEDDGEREGEDEDAFQWT